MVSQGEVIVYISAGCPYCEKVKEKLTEWGIEYDTRNVSLHKEYFDELRAKKVFGTPATYVDGKLILGFQENKLKKAFGIEEKDDEQLEAVGKVDAHATEDGVFNVIDNEVLDEVYDLIIVGGGPAGASAAVYSSRGKLNTLVIDKAPRAGTFALNQKIANYPGVRENLTGLELLTRIRLQAKDFGATFVRSTVFSVDFTKVIKEVEIPEGVVRAKTVFIAVGAKASGSKIKGEEEFVGRGVSYCTTCDAAFYEDKIVVVVGDNDEVVREALTLSKFCKEVRLLIPSGVIRGDVELSYVEKINNISIYKKYHLKEMIGDSSLEKVVVVDNNRNEIEWNVNGVFMYLGGAKPGTGFLTGAVKMDEDGFVIVDEHLRTNIPGVFAGGDARKTPIKQAILAAADGAIAAIGVEQYLNNGTKLKSQY